MTFKLQYITGAILPLIVVCMVVTARAEKRVIETNPTTRPGSAPIALTISLDDAVKIALKNSKSLLVAAEAVEKSRGKINESKAAYNPSLSGTGTYTHLDSGSTVEFQLGNDSKKTVIPLVKQDQKSIGLSASMPFDIVGLIHTSVELSQFQEIAARLDYNRSRNQVVVDTKNAFYDVLRARAFVTVSEQTIQNARERLKTAQSYLDAGTGTRFDVLRAETDVANAQQSLITAKNRVNLTTAMLNNVLNIDQNTPLQITESTEPDGAEQGFNEAITEAYGKRPELLQTDVYISAAKKGVRLAKRSALPSMGLNWNFSFTPDTGGFSPKATSWAAVAQINVPIFDQGLSRARVQQALSDVNTAELGKLQVQDAIALEVRQAYLALTEAKDRLNVTTTALTQAQEQYRLARVRFENGVTQTTGNSPLLEISDAQTALTQAENNQVNARYDVQNYRARLDKALGRYAYDAASLPGMTSPNAIAGGKK